MRLLSLRDLVTVPLRAQRAARNLAPSAAPGSKKQGPGFSLRPDLTGARGTSARAAISSYVVTTTAAVKLLFAFRSCRNERLVFPRRKTGARRILPCQRRIESCRQLLE